jgi:hypothetical protein
MTHEQTALLNKARDSLRGQSSWQLFTGGRYIAAAPIPPHFEVSQVKSLS